MLDISNPMEEEEELNDVRRGGECFRPPIVPDKKGLGSFQPLCPEGDVFVRFLLSLCNHLMKGPTAAAVKI